MFAVFVVQILVPKMLQASAKQLGKLLDYSFETNSFGVTAQKLQLQPQPKENQ